MFVVCLFRAVFGFLGLVFSIATCSIAQVKKQEILYANKVIEFSSEYSFELYLITPTTQTVKNEAIVSFIPGGSISHFDSRGPPII